MVLNTKAARRTAVSCVFAVLVTRRARRSSSFVVRSRWLILQNSFPDLNPQERVWKAVRRQISHNHLEVRLLELADRFFNMLNTSTFNNTFLDRYVFTAICPLFK
jgi:hypothetical protein